MNDLVQGLVAGGRLVSMERLRGGIGARNHALTIEAPGGERQRFVLRRFFAGKTGRHHRADVLFKNLALLEAAGVTAPRPVLLDTQGAFFGTPAVVMTRLPGKVLVGPRREDDWLRQLGDAIAAVHEVTPRSHDLSGLPSFLKPGMRAELDRGLPGHLNRSPLARRVHQVLTDHLDVVAELEPVLVHDDYWPGNTVWFRGRLTGIVDWTTAEVGDRRADVAQCRIDLLFIHGPDAPEGFLRAYEEAAGMELPDLWYWDLFRGIRALASYRRWLAGYHDLGLREITPALMHRRLVGFLEDARDRAR
jgi:aminoglycoside phosphotransferase (APT) family kinase protein